MSICLTLKQDHQNKGFPSQEAQNVVLLLLEPAFCALCKCFIADYAALAKFCLGLELFLIRTFVSHFLPECYKYQAKVLKG